MSVLKLAGTALALWFLTLVILLAFMAVNAHCGQIVPKWGFEKNVIAQGAGGGERMYGIEYIHPIKDSMFLKGDTGGWISRQDDRRSSPYASFQWGYRVQMTWGLFFEAAVGPGYVHALDARSSSHVNIFHDLGVGWLQNGYGLGLGFKHISNAGIVPPNLGRDFLGVRFLIPL